MKVLKFGGSSLASTENIQQVIDIIKQKKEQEGKIRVVVSAIGDATDNLINAAKLAAKQKDYQQVWQQLKQKHLQIAKEVASQNNKKQLVSKLDNIFLKLKDILQGVKVLEELSDQTEDKIMSFGERLSSLIISQAIEESYHIKADKIIITSSNFGQAEVYQEKTTQKINEYFPHKQDIVILGGFIGSTPEGNITTLGRGGSDYTAALLGAKLGAEAIEIWTDVTGVMTADPRYVEEAFPLEEITYQEAGELSHFGANVLHPKTMQPAQKSNIPIWIKNTFQSDLPGTKITNEDIEHNYDITGISSLEDVSLLRVQWQNDKNISNILSRIFDILSRSDLEILLTTQASSEQSISIAVKSQIAQQAKQLLMEAFRLEIKDGQMLPVVIEDNLAIVTVVGEQMKGTPGISGKFFATLGEADVNIYAIAQGSSELNISAVIKTEDESKALSAIHNSFYN